MAYGHGVVCQDVVYFIGVVYCYHCIGYTAGKEHLGHVARCYLEVFSSGEIPLVKRGGNTVASPCLGHIFSAQEADSIGRYSRQTIVFAHKALAV